MPTTSVFADRKMIVGTVAPTLFSSFVEHMGRCVYTGIYEPGHQSADTDGFRQDVLELVRELRVSMVRYPGGNFASGYDWRDGIGPKADRPVRAELAWQSTETNQFGTDEFRAWCGKAGVTPMMAVNLGSGTPMDAARLLEYSNHPGGTYFSELRKQNGREEPYGVKTWCLGNEMDGPWQIGGLSAEEYGRKALSAARMMRMLDLTVELVACGSSGREMPTFHEWDRITLDHLYEEVNYISMHRYYGGDMSLEVFFASYHDMDLFIQTVKATSDYVRAKHRSSKRMMISFDEWNVWHMNQNGSANWGSAPHILENIYTMKDALVFSGMLNTLLNNCDRVRMTSLAQLVNVIAPIFTAEGGAAIKQTIYHPFALASRYGRGETLRSIVTCDTFSSKVGEVNTLSCAVTHDQQERTLTAFLTNYAADARDCALELRGFGTLSPLECVTLNGDLEAKNTLNNPNAIKPRQCEAPIVHDNSIIAKLPPQSNMMLRFKYGDITR